jgi:hypothetical protein
MEHAMSANTMTERGGVLLTNDEGGFQAYLTIAGTNEWREISWRPDNYPALHTSVFVATQEELAAHINKNFVGWNARKMNLPRVDLSVDAVVIAPT